MDDDLPTVSEKFNKSFGDFAVVSSDNVIFYVPKYLLQYSSGVFRSMFEVGTSPRSQSQSPESESTPVLMQGDAQTLETIFTICHPAFPTPEISGVDELARIMRIARKYEMEQLEDRMREALTKQRITETGLQDPLATTSPLQSFAISASFSWENEARFALREVIKSDMEVEIDNAKEYEISLALFQHIYKLRNARCNFFLATLGLITKYALTSLDKVRWTSEGSQKILARPSLETLESLIKSHSERLNVDSINRVLSQWRAEAKALEETFPNLPSNL